MVQSDSVTHYLAIFYVNLELIFILKKTIVKRELLNFTTSIHIYVVIGRVSYYLLCTLYRKIATTTKLCPFLMLMSVLPYELIQWKPLNHRETDNREIRLIERSERKQIFHIEKPSVYRDITSVNRDNNSRLSI